MLPKPIHHDNTFLPVDKEMGVCYNQLLVNTSCSSRTRYQTWQEAARLTR